MFKPDAELVEDARHMLAHCKLSGTAIDICQEVVNGAFDRTDRSGRDRAETLRRAVTNLNALNGLPPR